MFLDNRTMFFLNLRVQYHYCIINSNNSFEFWYRFICFGYVNFICQIINYHDDYIIILHLLSISFYFVG